MLSEAAARWLLVVHTVVGAAAVGAATHLVIWVRRLVRGQPGRLRPARRFAWIVLACQVGAFVAGNAMYPTYKVEVRTAYLENREAITADRAAHQAQLARIAGHEAAPTPALSATGGVIKRAAAAARWFDVKEHWVALGVLASLALVLALAFWDPRAAPELGVILLGLAIVVAGTVWLGAIIGVLTASWRAV
jgi:hypothetical protein